MIVTEDTAQRIAAALEQLLDVVREIKPDVKAPDKFEQYGFSTCLHCHELHPGEPCPAKPLPPISPTGRWA